jgi:hypothetical protein
MFNDIRVFHESLRVGYLCHTATQNSDNAILRNKLFNIRILFQYVFSTLVMTVINCQHDFDSLLNR